MMESRDDVELGDLAWDAPAQKGASLSGRERKIMIAAAVVVVVVVLAAVGVSAYFISTGGDSSDDSIEYIYHDEYTKMYETEKRVAFRTPVMTVHAGKHNEVMFANAPRPDGDIAVHMIRARVHDAGTGRMVPITQVYNHHILIGDYHDRDPHTIRGMAAIGAEAMRFDRPLQRPFVMISPAENEWVVAAHLVNTWGLASLASIDVYVEYEVFYREIEDMNEYLPFAVDMDIYGQGISESSSEESVSEAYGEEEQTRVGVDYIDETNVVEDEEPPEDVEEVEEERLARAAEGSSEERVNPFDTSASWNVVYTRSSYHDDSFGEVGVDIPGDGGAGSVHEIETVFKWTADDTVLVWAQGHVHIGASSITMYDYKSGKEVFTSRVMYNASGYVEDITFAPLMMEVHRGQMFRTVARYDNSVDYGNVMALVLLGTTTNVDSVAALERAMDAAPAHVMS